MNTWILLGFSCIDLGISVIGLASPLSPAQIIIVMAGVDIVLAGLVLSINGVRKLWRENLK